MKMTMPATTRYGTNALILWPGDESQQPGDRGVGDDERDRRTDEGRSGADPAVVKRLAEFEQGRRREGGDREEERQPGRRDAVDARERARR